jgi:peptide/nickel transport system ATP-binding protein
VRARTRSGNVDDSVIRLLLQRVGLGADMCEKYPRQLSGGERQRVALARSLSVEPALLLLDEPTSSLDAVTQVQILQLIQSIQETVRTAILFISHDIASIVRLCDHIAVLYDGRIVEQGTTASILAHPVHHYTKQIAAHYS